MLNLGTPKESCESDIDDLTHLSRVELNIQSAVTTLTNCDTFDHKVICGWCTSSHDWKASSSHQQSSSQAVSCLTDSDERWSVCPSQQEGFQKKKQNRKRCRWDHSDRHCPVVVIRGLFILAGDKKKRPKKKGRGGRVCIYRTETPFQKGINGRQCDCDTVTVG